MKVGDLVFRKSQLGNRTIGLILSKQMAGNPAHRSVTVFYPETGRTWVMAESLMEVANESR